MERSELKVGTKVKLTVEADRYPHFIAPSGTTGTVVHNDEHEIHVKADQLISGCEEWDNCIHFYHWDNVNDWETLEIIS